MVFLRKYNVALTGGTKIRVPMLKYGSNDYAASADWTPATGDVKVSLDGGAEANVGTLPSYSNGAWEFTLTGAELSAKSVAVKVVDSATKAVEDQFLIVETFGHASAMYLYDPQDGAGLGLSRIDATVSSRSSHTAADAAAAIWGAAVASYTALGTFGKFLQDRLDVVLSTRLAASGYTAPDNAGINSKLDAIDDYVDTEVAAIKTVTDKVGGMIEASGGHDRYKATALEQAPTGGGGSGGLTVDEHAKLMSLGAAPVNLVSAVGAGGAATLTRGAAYKAAQGNALAWAVTKDLAGATLALRLDAADGPTLGTATATGSGSDWTVSVDVDDAETALLDRRPRRFLLVATLGGDPIELLSGLLTVN